MTDLQSHLDIPSSIAGGLPIASERCPIEFANLANDGSGYALPDYEGLEQRRL